MCSLASISVCWPLSPWAFHPLQQFGAQRCLFGGVPGIVGQVAGLERIVDDVVKLFAGAVLVAVHLSAGEFVGRGFLLPRSPPVAFRVRGHALERRLGREV